MKVTGEARLRAPVERVWEALTDPAVLARTIPGCVRLEETGPDEYRMTVRAGVASIKGTYLGTVRLADQDRPGSFVLEANGAGGPGTVDAQVTVRLAADGDQTRLDYAADAAVGGTIAGVGQRVLAGVAKKTAREFFDAVDADLNGGPAPAATVPGAGAATAGPAMAPGEVETVRPGAGRVFTAPSAGTRPLAGASANVLAGGAIALAGVLLGWSLGRRGGR
jgi:carbon monoxide dehydrogenase subunit G